MKKLILVGTLFFTTFLSGDYLDVSVETNSNYRFEDYLFKDTNTTNTEKLEKTISYNQLHLSGNFNNIIGFNYYKNDISSPDKFDSKEIYLGSDKTKFLGYQKDETTIYYGTRINRAKTTRYTIYDILTVEQNRLTTSGEETFIPGAVGSASQDGIVYRTMNYDKYVLSSENLYNHVKENAINGENYFYGVAGVLNAYSMFRIYGIAIASYEQNDFSKGTAKFDNNGTMQNVFDGDADRQKLLPTDGRFKGFGYGYKVTAEAYWKDLSIFITSYYKKTKLKNYHTDVRDALPDADPVANIISINELNFLQKYTSFGLRYRF